MLIERVAGRPWAIQAEIAAHVRGLVLKDGFAGLRHLAGLKAGIHAFDEDARPQARRGSPSAAVGGIAVIPVIGTLTQRPEVINSTVTRSADEIAAEVTAAAADPNADAIVLDIDSPGGEVFGIPEAWSAIRKARALKPVIAAANSAAASGAYYLATAAEEILVTPSGMVGSIGVYMLHVDFSKWLEAEGETWTFISAGKFKVEGNPAEPLGEEARAAMQADVDGYYRDFVRDVAKGRRVPVENVRNGFGEGRMVRAAPAVAEGMADAVGTLEDAIRRAAQLAGERRRESARAEAPTATPQAEEVQEPLSLDEMQLGVDI